MKSEEESPPKKRDARIKGIIFFVGAAVMSLLAVVLPAAVPGPNNFLHMSGGIAVAAVMAILGIIMFRRGAEKP